MPTDQPDLVVERYLRRLGGGRPDPAALAFYAAFDQMRSVDPLVAERVVAELRDQRANIKLIASENYASLAVQQAMGNLLTDKYAEGFTGHRFYAGCDNVDAIEGHGAELAKALFGAEHAYLQPHSGIDANLVAFIAILATRVEDGFLERLDVKNVSALSDEQFAALRTELHDQRLLGMDYYSGGHLTHGYRFNISSRLFDARGYTVDRETGLLDLDALRAQLHEVRPLILLAGYSAYPRKIDFARMRELADEVGATFMVDMAHFAGLVAGKVFTGDYDPVPHAHVVTSTTHKTLRGPRGGIVLSSAEYADAVDKGCPAVLGGPLPHVMASKAIALREASQPSFREYAARIVENAQALAEGLQRRGLRVATGGTDNHLVLADVASSFGLTGRQAESALRAVGMTLNRNSLPFDANGPWYTSGLRLGTPALTTLGMGTDEVDEIAAVLVDVLRATTPVTVNGKPSKAKYETDGKVAQEARARVAALGDKFPVYPEIDLSIVEGRGIGHVHLAQQAPIIGSAVLPLREYLLTGLTATVVTFLLTGPVRVLAVRLGAVAWPRGRDVHSTPTPRWGGLAMLGGVLAGVLLAYQLPALRLAFDYSDEVVGALVAVVVLGLVGVLDDRFELDAITKLAGQTTAAGLLVLAGVQWVTFWIPWGGGGAGISGSFLILGEAQGVLLTVVLTVALINAMNFVDGLDGLAAGIGLIAASATALFAIGLVRANGNDPGAYSPALLAVVLAGACLGFLPHNFNPARIFMGDSGSMLIGLMLAAATTTTASGRILPDATTSATDVIALFAPILAGAAVVFVPLLDLLMAVVRRTRKGMSPFSPDKMHLHHRLLEIGHSHRRAVLLIYLWAGVLAYGAVALALIADPFVVLWAVGIGLLVAVLASAVPRLRAPR